MILVVSTHRFRGTFCIASVPVWRPEKLFAVARIYLYWLQMKLMDNSATNVGCTSIVLKNSA